MKLFLTSILILLLGLLVLSDVIANRPDERIKVIYDSGYYRSNTRNQNFIFFYTRPNPNMGEMDDRDYRNGTSELEIGLGDETRLTLVHNSEKPSLDDLSFVLESVSGMQECDLAPAFKNLTEKCKGPIRVRELTGEEKSKAQERKQLLAASLEAKKRELNGTSDELGEFRLLVDKVTSGTIFEAIGIQISLFSDNALVPGAHLETLNREGTSKGARKVLFMEKVPKSFAVENILEANKEELCKQSQLKNWIKYCFLADLRPLTKDERSQLDDLKGSI